MRKKCYSDPQKILRFKAKGQEFANILRSLEQIIRRVKGQNNFGSRMLFKIIPGGFSDLIYDNNYNSNWKKNWDLETSEKVEIKFFIG